MKADDMVWLYSAERLLRFKPYVPRPYESSKQMIDRARTLMRIQKHGIGHVQANSRHWEGDRAALVYAIQSYHWREREKGPVA